MPSYRSINIALHSQFEMEKLPEYYPPPPPSAPALTMPAMAPFVQDATSTCAVYIPVLPGSQFWIAYSVSPPVPEEHYFVFKLFVDGEHVVSWSTGREDGWMGKTMFGLFDAGDGRRMEKRVLCFSARDKEGGPEEGCVEIRVLRASGRKRVERETRVYGEMEGAGKERGVRLVNAGRAGPELPKRFYKFALIDPVDQPFATFRYYYRTWEQLRNLGLLDMEYCTESEGSEMSVIEPEDGTADSDGSKEGAGHGKIAHEPDDVCGEGDGISVHDWVTEHRTQKTERASTRAQSSTDTDTESSHQDSIASGTYIPRGAPSEAGSPQSLRRCGRLNTYRLSMPPPIRLDAPQPTWRPPPLPQKNELSSSTAYRPHPAYPVEEWTVRTPRPVPSVRDAITTPPLERRKGLGITGAGLMGVISSTWKRGVSAESARRVSH